MFNLIETMRVEDGVIKRLDLHMARFNRSCEYFNLQTVNLKDELECYIKENKLKTGVYKLRIEYRDKLKITHEALKKTVKVDANVLPITGEKEFLEHKTTVRNQYVTTDYPFALYYDETNRITEFNIGNVVIEDNGMCYTPKEGRLLNGVMRQSLLNNGTITLRDYQLEEFIDRYKREKINVYLINSLREWVKVDLHV